MFQQVDDFVEFGDSWELEEGECKPTDVVDPCDEDAKQYEDAQDICYLVVLEVGPFAPCHALVDPLPYYEACVYDLCATLPDDDLVCDSFSEYAQACRDAGGQPEEWRDQVPQCGMLLYRLQ